MMKSVKFIVCTPDKAVADVNQALSAALAANHKVLWLVSGGSNIEIECEISSRLLDTGNLTAALVDERYGQPGHKDSNYQKLVEAGFRANLTPVLQKDNLDIAKTTKQYAETLQGLLDEADIVIAQLGIGTDGHTAGVLPGSPLVASKQLVGNYHGTDFKRISVTLQGLRFIDAAFVFAYGSEKQAALRSLRDQALPLAEQPCQIFRQLPHVTIYNDAIEGDV